MAITAVVVSATLNTTGDTAFTSSGFGTPDAAIILIGRGNTTNNPGTHATFTGGFWCSDPGQAGITFGSEDAQSSSDTRRYGDSTYAGHVASPTADSVTISYSASATTDGINLSVAAGSTTISRYASVILLKGLTNAHVGSINLGTGTSAINVTAPGFRADLVLLLSAWAEDATVSAGARGSFGAAQISAGGTVAQGCMAFESTDAAGASTARTIVLNDKALARITSGALAVECAIGANDNGFSITPSADSGSQYAYYLAIECPDPEDAYVGVVDTITGTGDQAYTGAGLTPQAIVLASTLATAVDTVTDSGAFNVGFGGPATSEWSSVYIDEYASDPTDTEGYVDTSNILHIRSAVDTEDTVASLTAFGADGWTLNYSDGSGAARKILAIAIGNSSSGRTGTLAATESGSDTASISGDVLVKGALAATESGADTASISGDVLVKGALAATESGADSAALAGKVLVKGALAASESGSDTAALAGDVLVKGALAASETGNDSAQFVGEGFVPTATGTLAASESGSDTASIAGKVYVAGTLSAVEGGLDGFAASGDILVKGTLAASETGDDTAAFAQEILTLTQADLDAIAAAVWADPRALTLQKFMALK